MKVNCNACHIKGKPKTDRNDFGKLFAKELKASDPTLTDSGVDPATTKTKDADDENGRSDLSKEKPASDSESKSKKG